MILLIQAIYTINILKFEINELSFFCIVFYIIYFGRFSENLKIVSNSKCFGQNINIPNWISRLNSNSISNMNWRKEEKQIEYIQNQNYVLISSILDQIVSNIWLYLRVADNWWSRRSVGMMEYFKWRSKIDCRKKWSMKQPSVFK